MAQAALQRGRGRRRPPLVRWLVWIALFCALIYLCAAFCFVALKWIPPFTTAVQIERRVEAAAAHQAYRKQYRFVRLSSISPHLQHAVVAAEDSRFYQHHGFDWQEIQKVVESGMEEGHMSRGASTITQQLVKNLFLTTGRNWFRKGAEFALVPLAEHILGKRRILELYLNVIEWGPGVYGAEAAAQHWFGEAASEVSRDQAARLAAVIPAPSRRNPARMGSYSSVIMHRMAVMGW